MQNHYPSKGRRSRLLCAALATVLGLLGAQQASAADLTIRIAWYMSPGTAVDTQGQEVADKIESMSHGRIKVNTFPSGSLLKASNISMGLANNTVNMSISGMHWWANQAPSLQWDTIPFLVTDASELIKKLHGPLGDDVNKQLNRFGAEAIGWSFYGYALSYINARHPVKVPADLKGLKMRSEGKLSSIFLKSQGATPVSMDSSEVYTAMQRGTLDGATSGTSSMVSRNWYEVGPYVTAIHYAPLVYPIQVNKQWWEGLKPGQRQLIQKAVASTERDAAAEIEKEFRHDIVLMKKHGNQVHRPNERELKKWRQATEAQARKQYLKGAGAEGKKVLHDIDAPTAQDDKGE